MNKIFVLALIILMVIGCRSKLSDPLNGLVIGSNETTWKKDINSLVEKEKLTCINEGRKYYGFIFDSVYVDIETNTEFNFGKLLDYKLSFASKPEFYFAPNKSYFPLGIRYMDIYNLFQKMIQLYGDPDSIIITYSDKLYPAFTDKPLIDSLIGGFKALWKEKNYNVFFDVGKLGLQFDSTGEKIEDFTLSLSEIYYQHPNYEKEIAFITDSVISEYGIEDYIQSEVDSPVISRSGYDYEINNREITFPVIHFTRIDNLDNRGIVSVLVDIELYDNFENELAKLEDIEFGFGNKILVTTKRKFTEIPNETFESMERRVTQEYNQIFLFNRTYNYTSRSSSLQLLESAFQKGMKVNAKFKIKAIKFDNSSVLKL